MNSKTLIRMTWVFCIITGTIANSASAQSSDNKPPSMQDGEHSPRREPPPQAYEDCKGKEKVISYKFPRLVKEKFQQLAPLLLRDYLRVRNDHRGAMANRKMVHHPKNSNLNQVLLHFAIRLGCQRH